ncbi:hypothetical protein Bca4012_045977 [Brassica carinata]
MRNIIILVLAMILFSNSGELESSTNQELLQSRHYPRFSPKPHWPFRGSRKAFPPLPSGHFQPTPFHPPPEVIKCLSAKDEVRKCFDDIAFFTKKAATGSECCAAIQKRKEDCKKTIFGYFHKPFWTGYFKLHCSSVVGSTSPAPSLAPSPAPSPAHTDFSYY